MSSLTAGQLYQRSDRSGDKSAVSSMLLEGANLLNCLLLIQAEDGTPEVKGQTNSDTITKVSNRKRASVDQSSANGAQAKTKRNKKSAEHLAQAGTSRCIPFMLATAEIMCYVMSLFLDDHFYKMECFGWWLNFHNKGLGYIERRCLDFFFINLQYAEKAAGYWLLAQTCVKLPCGKSNYCNELYHKFI